MKKKILIVDDDHDIHPLIVKIIEKVNKQDGNKFGEIDNLKIGIVGDILHSRVALSNIYGLTKLGASVKVCGPPHLIQKDIETKDNLVISNETNEPSLINSPNEIKIE